MDEFGIEFTPRETPLDYDRLVSDLRAAILTICQLGLERINADLRSGGALTLGIIEAQAGGPSPEWPPEFRRVLGALKHLALALGDLSEKSSVPDLVWDPRTVADVLLEAERAAMPATEESR